MDQYFGLVRYDADGTVDTTFGGDRRVITNFTSGDDDVSDVAIQADGKIVAVGRSGDEGPGSLTKFAVARYNTDGTLDTTFGGNGKVTTKIIGFDFANAAAIQGDGKIIAAGGSGEVNGKFALVRYESASSPENPRRQGLLARDITRRRLQNHRGRGPSCGDFGRLWQPQSLRSCPGAPTHPATRRFRCRQRNAPSRLRRT